MKWRIYRPGMVVGHSGTGEMDKIDGPYYFFELLNRISRVAPKWLPLLMNKAGVLNIVPVDYVVDAIDCLAHVPDHNHDCFFITDQSSSLGSDKVCGLTQEFLHVRSFYSAQWPQCQSAAPHPL